MSPPSISIYLVLSREPSLSKILEKHLEVQIQRYGEGAEGKACGRDLIERGLPREDAKAWCMIKARQAYGSGRSLS